MFDMKLIRETPDAFDAGLARRGQLPRAGEVLALDEEARKYTHALNELQARRNAALCGEGCAGFAVGHDLQAPEQPAAPDVAHMRATHGLGNGIGLSLNALRIS